MRAVNFELQDEELQLDFGTYALMMYYADQVDPILAKLLYDSSITEYRYKIAYHLPKGLFSDENYEAHFETSELHAVVNFIEEQLNPALSIEKGDLLQKFGGVDVFYNIFDQGSDFLDNIGLNEGNEFFYSNPVDIAMFFNEYKALLKLALQLNTPFTVRLDF